MCTSCTFFLVSLNNFVLNRLLIKGKRNDVTNKEVSMIYLHSVLTFVNHNLIKHYVLLLIMTVILLCLIIYGFPTEF